MIISTIHAEAETVEVAEAQPQENSLQSAYEAGHDNNAGDTRKRERTTREAMPAADTLAEAEGAHREWSEADKQRAAKLPKREQTLSEALSGQEPEDAEVLIEDGIPTELAGYDAAQIGAAMVALGLSHADLEDPRWIPVLLQQLEASNPDADPDAESEGETEDETEDKEKSEEEKKADEPKKPFVHVELQPEQVTEYVAKTWERAEQVSSPQMSKLFADSLATALGTPPEQRELLDNVVSLLNYGGVSLIQSAVPALVTEYLQQNVMAIMQQVLPHAMEGYLPGVQDDYTVRTLDRIWSAAKADDDSLPDYGTTMGGSPEFRELVEAIHAKHPFLNSIEFRDDKGNPLHALDKLRAKAELVIRLHRGEAADPKAINEAVQRGRTQERESAARSSRKVTARGSLGAGRTTGTPMEKKEAHTSLRDAYSAHNSGAI